MCALFKLANLHKCACHLTLTVLRSLVHNAASGGNAQLLSYLLDSGGATSVTKADDEVISPPGSGLGIVRRQLKSVRCMFSESWP